MCRRVAKKNSIFFFFLSNICHDEVEPHVHTSHRLPHHLLYIYRLVMHGMQGETHKKLVLIFNLQQLCEVVFNEVEGLLAENLTESAIASELQQNVCPRLPSIAKDMCFLLSDHFLPYIISKLETHIIPGEACTELKLCDSVPTPHVDPDPVNTFIVDLDLPPTEHFASVCSQPQYVGNVQEALTWLKSWLPLDALTKLQEMGQDIASYLPYPFADEITGCAAGLGIPAGDLLVLNVAYELTDSCIVEFVSF